MRAWVFRLFTLAAVVGLDAAADVTPLPGASGQHARAGFFFPNPIAVLVTDQAGKPVPEAVVHWALHPFQPSMPSLGYSTGTHLSGPISWTHCNAPNSARETFCSMTSGADGVAILPPAYGPVAGRYQLMIYASMAGTSLGFAAVELVVDPRVAPPTLSVISGSGESIVAGMTGGPFKVRAVKANGEPFRGSQVTFFALSPAQPELHFGGGGTFLNMGVVAKATIDAEGYAVSPVFTTKHFFGPGRVVASIFDPEAAAYVWTYLHYTNTTVTGISAVTFQDMWWGGPSQNGWGLSIVQHGVALFVVVYAYDDAGQPRWFVVPNGFWHEGLGSRFSGSIFWPRGSPFYSYDPSKFALGPSRYDLRGDGFVYVENRFSLAEFSGPEHGKIQFELGDPAHRVGGFAEISRLDISSDIPAPLTGLGDMWWGGEGQNGWGIAMLEQPGGLFSIWLTYDAVGDTTWFVMPTGEWTDERTYVGRLYRPSGVGRPGPTYKPERFAITDVGTFRYRFSDKDHASVEFIVDGHRVAHELTRLPF